MIAPSFAMLCAHVPGIVAVLNAEQFGRVLESLELCNNALEA